MRIFLPVIFLMLCSNTFSKNTVYTRYVNPFIGTSGMGHTFPGAVLPFGAVQLSPDTDTIPHNIKGKYQKKVYEYCAGYRYNDNTIVGFSHTHFSGTGHSDLGDILLMPGIGEIKLNPGTSDHPESGYRSRYSHTTEKASPGYYEVMLEDYKIKVRLTATKRAGIHQYIYPTGETGHLIIDLNHSIYNYDGKTLWAEIRVENDTLLTGYRITNGWARTNYTYFAISFSKPIKEYGYKDLAPIYYKGGYGKFNQNHNFPEMAGRKLVAWLKFDTLSNNKLTVKVGISATGTTGAIKNLRSETKGKSFDALASEANKQWNNELSIIDIKGSDEEKTMFYTSLYHTMINPSLYMDVDGNYRGIDKEIHNSKSYNNYTVFSLWDTYRALHPLLTLLKPDIETDIIKSMLSHYRQSVHGMLPIWSHMGNENWCMTGYHAVSVLTDAIVKGLAINGSEALKAMKSTSNVKYYGNLWEYIDKGYVSIESSSTSASNTLEYSYDDWTIWNAARTLGDTVTMNLYKPRALYYRNVFDTSIGFSRPRHRDGSFKQNFDIKQTTGEGFIEGNSFNFSFHAPHDIYGLMALMGGEKSFLKNIDSLFTSKLPEYCYKDNEDITSDCLIGGYVHGNEPSHHIPYLYSWTSEPWKTQFWLREIINRMYKPQISGLGGNDDCGQMSAWYIFTSLGFYPVCPGSDQYVIGVPYFPWARIKLPNGNILSIKAEGVSDKNRFVKIVLINGKPYNKLFITHNKLLKGGEIKFIMTSKPNKNRGLKNYEKPYSMTNGE